MNQKYTDYSRYKDGNQSDVRFIEEEIKIVSKRLNYLKLQ